MSSSLLRGNDVTLAFAASPKLKPKVLGISMPAISVTMRKDLTIVGAKLQNPYIRNITLTGSNSSTILALSEVEFASKSGLHLFGGQVSVNLSDAHDNQLGYAVIPHFDLFPGYNKVGDIKTVIEYKDNWSNTSGWNNASVDAFVNILFSGAPSELIMTGPLGDLVISDTIDE